VPWVDRAQEEHDRFAQTLRDRGVEVLYLHTLLAETLEHARGASSSCWTRPCARRPSARRSPDPREHLASLPGPELAEVLMAGMAHEELPVSGGLVDRMTGALDFIIRPLPNLLFTRDSSVWLERGVAVTSLAMPARRRESTDHRRDLHAPPALPGHRAAVRRQREAEAWLEGGDVLVLAPACWPWASASARARPAWRRSRSGCSRPARAHGAGGADRPGPRDDAPRHRLHDGRPRRGGHVPAVADSLEAFRSRRRRGRRPRQRTGAVPAHRRQRRWASTGCGSSTPGLTR
jgi:hypothetical protein